MRSNILLMAIGLLATDSALAGPCKPRASTSGIVTSTAITSTIVGEMSTVPSSATSTEAVNSATTTVSDVTATSEEDTTTALESTATAGVTTTTAAAETTTATTAADETAITTTAAIPTFSILGGEGGSPLEGYNIQGNNYFFNPEDGQPTVRSFTFDPATGRLRDIRAGGFACANYRRNSGFSDPANIGTCQPSIFGIAPSSAYLSCQLNSGDLTCTAPRRKCFTDPNNGGTTCEDDTTGAINNSFYYQHINNNADFLYISTNDPSGYTSVNLVTQSEI
ncbi:hypothetical protein FGRMN_10822 [Fusarium graminum]|nr:hypothetical protein FGRMN_10822 [Fusarium graminum]